MPWKNLLLLTLAGGAGTLARYGLTAWMQRFGGEGGFPWGTLAVNALGCLLFGLAVGALESRVHLSPQVRLIVLTGFMGAFTTFSTFAFETTHLARASGVSAAMANLAAHNLLGLAMALAGFLLGRLL
jgi:CrcB protein